MMIQIHSLRTAALAALVSLITFASAQAEYVPNDQDHLVLYGGYFDVTQDDNGAALVGLEYRYQDIFYGLRPTVGGFVTSDEAYYGYAGIFWDIYLSDSWVFTPNSVVGAFSQGDGKDLGHWIEFRSGLELSYEFDDAQRLGVAFNHLSNASLGERNPGAETLIVQYSYPIGR